MSLEKQFKEDMDLIADALSKNINGIRTVTFNTVKGQMSRRIFQQGQSTDGSPIGQYAKSTKKQRERGGRQTNKVDLEMTGELRRSFIVGTESNKVVMGLLENNEPKISVSNGVVRVVGTTDFTTTENAIQQEQNFGKDIFAPSESEIETGEEVFLFEVDKLIKKTLGKTKTVRVKRK